MTHHCLSPTRVSPCTTRVIRIHQLTGSSNISNLATLQNLSMAAAIRTRRAPSSLHRSTQTPRQSSPKPRSPAKSAEHPSRKYAAPVSYPAPFRIPSAFLLRNRQKNRPQRHRLHRKTPRPRKLRFSSARVSAVHALSTNRTIESVASYCNHDGDKFPPARVASAPEPSRITVTSRNLSDKTPISSEKSNRPCSKKPTWLEKLSISAKSCDERKIVVSGARSSNPSISSSRTSGSSPANGSSSTSSCGRNASAEAIAAFIRCPRDNCFSFRPAGKSNCRISCPSSARSHVG